MPAIEVLDHPSAAEATWPVGLVLRLGMRGAHVSQLRRALAEHGYGTAKPAAPADDVYDERLRVLVLQFQREHGLTADGLAGPHTLAALAQPVLQQAPADALAPLRQAAQAARGHGWERALVVAQAAETLHIRETGGNNRGPLVEAMQLSAGGKPGDAWCAAFCDVCQRLGYQAAGETQPLRIGLSCSALIRRAAKLGRVFEYAGYGNGEFPPGTPAPGDVIILRGGKTGYRHAGMVLQGPEGNGIVQTIEGNTNDAGSADGDGVYRKLRRLSRTSAVFVTLRPLPG